jgi:hypothetical protein
MAGGYGKQALGGFLVDKIFSDVDKTITRAIDQTQDAGNGLIMHTANQASILEQDAILLLGDQRQKTYLSSRLESFIISERLRWFRLGLLL